MRGECPDCDLCEVMPDGTLFCALYEEQVHGHTTCRHWQSDPDLFIRIDVRNIDQFNEEAIGFGEEDYK